MVPNELSQMVIEVFEPKNGPLLRFESSPKTSGC